MNVSSNCVPINFTNRLIYEPKDLISAMELLQLSYPNRDNTFGNWGHLNTGWLVAFYIYIAVFGVAYFVLGTVSLLVLVHRDGRRVLKELNHKIVYTLACINILLVILGYSKFLFFILDPYYISNYLTCEYCHLPWSLMESLSLPSITIAFTMEFFTLWLCVQMVRKSVFDKCRFVVLFTFLNFFIVIIVQLIANLFVYPGIIAIIACAIYFICFGIIVCLAYILTAWRVLGTIETTAHRATLIQKEKPTDKESINKTTIKKIPVKPHTSNKNPPTYTYRETFSITQKKAILKISKICYGTAFLGLLLSVVQVVLLVILSRVLLTDCISTLRTDKNLWLTFQCLRDCVKLAMGFILLYCTADFDKLWKWMTTPCCRQ